MLSCFISVRFAFDTINEGKDDLTTHGRVLGANAEDEQILKEEEDPTIEVSSKI